MKMRKWKLRSYLSMAFAVLVIGVLVLLPLFYFKWTDQSLMSQTHKIGKMNYELSSDVKNIYMVQRLHNIINSLYSDNTEESQTIIIQEESAISGDYNIDLDEDFYQSECVDFQVQELRSYENIGQTLLEGFADINGQISDHNDLLAQNKDSVIYYHFTSNNKKFSCKYDTASGKIIMMSISSNQVENISDEEKRKIYQEFLSYLNVTIVGDWYYSGERMISDKAHLALNLKEKNNIWSLEFEAY